VTEQRGFSLIELAIVLVIVTLLIGGLAVPLSAQIQARRVAETRQTLQEARDALLGYAMTNLATTAGKRHLPCPDITGDGREDRTGAGCTGAVGAISYGWLPWVTLGTAAQDAWGNRLRYIVESQFADSATGFSRSTVIGDSPIQICTTHTCPSPLVADNVVFGLVSHGPNGWGALSVSGTTLAAPSGPDELENLDQNSTLVARSQTKADTALGEFDDLAVWVPLTELILRVCPTGSDCDQ
jgi:prepilin-type N-terminal cleavage/methylation domain-containing protein